MENENLTIALLIDTDNVSAKYMNVLDKELIVLGKVTYKRMYGDFTQNSANGWRDLVNKFSITPMQQYSYTTGKNATDHKMVIDAMDILYTNHVNAFCLMTSDSDFTGLAKRLKESNIYVIGAGESKTPKSFVRSCDRFFMLDKLAHVEKETECKVDEENSRKDEDEKKPLSVPTQSVPQEAEPLQNAETEEVPVLQESEPIPNPATEEGAVLSREEVEQFAVKLLEDIGKPFSLATLMQKIYQAYPQFSYRDFGAKKAIDFFGGEPFKISKPNGKNTDRMISIAPYLSSEKEK